MSSLNPYCSGHQLGKLLVLVIEGNGDGGPFDVGHLEETVVFNAPVQRVSHGTLVGVLLSLGKIREWPQTSIEKEFLNNSIQQNVYR